MKNSKSSQQPSLSPSEKRQIKNEIMFRKANEKVQKELLRLKRLAKAEGEDAGLPAEDMEIHFFCECSDKNCLERIPLTLSKYQELHRDRSHFIVMPNHETKSIENVILENPKYSVVDKLFPLNEGSVSLR